MKKLLLFCSVAAIGAATVSAQIGDVRFVNFGKKQQSEASVRNRDEAVRNIRRAAAKQLWKAGTVASYDWLSGEGDPSSTGWFLNTTTKYEYNSDGNVTRYSNSNEICEYSFDSEGRCIGMITYDPNTQPLTPYSKQEYVYDTVVKNLVVSTLTYFMNEGKWELNYGDRSVITRNADGNVVKIVSQNYQNWGETPAWIDDSMVEIGYGTDKKANSIKMTSLYDGVTEVEAELVDVVWYETDGQIVDFEMDEYEFFMGPNRLRSARGLAEYTYPYAGDIYYAVEYKPADAGFKMTATMNNATYAWEDYTVLDANGSYRDEYFEVDYDHMDDGSYQPDDPDLTENTRMYDAYGLTLKDSEISYVDGDKAKGISYQSERVGTVTYDPTHGYPLEYIMQSSYDGAPLENRSREVYGDYVDVIGAGISDAEVSEDAPVEYFNLQGVRVQNPANGLYIRRQGTKVSKVFVK